MSSPAPLYITIGPPCSGKTTWLREHEILDIAIDDQPEVYHSLPLSCFLDHQSRDRQRIIGGQSVKERLQEQGELCCVLSRLTNRLSAAECRNRLLSRDHGDPAIETLLSKVEQEISAGNFEPPETVDLFVRQALFPKAIDGAYNALESSATNLTVAWGNTNTRVSDYERALAYAARARRPVEFVVYGGSRLPDVGFEELMKRNVRRLIRTGRYVPARVLADMEVRARELIQRLDSDKSLAEAAQFQFNDDKTVSPRPRGDKSYDRHRSFDQRRQWDRQRSFDRSRPWDRRVRSRPQDISFGRVASAHFRSSSGGGSRANNGLSE